MNCKVCIVGTLVFVRLVFSFLCFIVILNNVISLFTCVIINAAVSIICVGVFIFLT